MLALILSAAMPAGPMNAEVNLVDGAYQVRWESPAPVDVYISSDPDGADSRLISEADADGVHEAPRGEAAARSYFILRGEAGTETVTALRLLPLEGGRNFRDLGGYETESGQTVAWGRVYRSGVMTELTASDYRYLAGLGIGVVCDFRSVSEREEEPTDWAAGDIDYVAWDYEMDPSDFTSAFADGEMSAERSREAFIGFYRQTPYAFADRYADMFDRLAAGEIPLAFNCSAGKDRTGVAAALLLSALGVPRETIVADYALSDDYVDYMAELARDRAQADLEPDDPMYMWSQLPPEVLAPFMASDPAYIQASFDQIEADHGDVRTFLREVVDVTDAELAAIRAALLR